MANLGHPQHAPGTSSNYPLKNSVGKASYLFFFAHLVSYAFALKIRVKAWTAASVV